MMRYPVPAAAVACVLLASCSDSQPRAAERIPAISSAALSAGVPDLRLDSLLAAAEASYRDGDYVAARSVWLDALRQVSTLGDSLAEPRILTWLGLTAWRQGEYGEARRLGEQALSLKIRTRHPELWKSYNALGLLAWNQGRLADASGLFENALRSAQDAGDQEGLAKGASNLGLVQTELGEFGKARRGFLAAHQAGRALADGQIEGGALTNLGMLSVRTGDPLSATHSLEAARRIYQSIDYPAGEENVLGQMGTAYTALGDFRRALATLDSARSLARQHGLRQEEANDLEMTAALYQQVGDHKQALRKLAEAKAIATELGLGVESGNILREEASIHAGLGSHGMAQSRLLEALQLHRSAGAKFAELHDLLMLAEVASLAGKSSDAARALRGAKTLAASQDAPITARLVAITEARIADRVGSPAAVLQTLEPLGRDPTEGVANVEWEREALRARAFARLGRLDSAAVAGRRALASVERARGTLASGALRTVFTTDKSAVYADLALVLLRLGRKDEAFRVADAARGRALLEHLSAAREGVRMESPVGNFAEAERLLRRIDALVARIRELEQESPEERGPTSALTAGHIARQLEDVRSEYEALFIRAAEQQPRNASLLGARPVGADQIRAALRPGELLLEYLVAQDRVLIFALDRQAVHTFESPVPASELATRVRLARALLGQRGIDPHESAAVLRALSSALVGPVARAGLLRGVTQLVVVPHGALTYLSMGALSDPTTGSLLLEKHAISSLPSAAALPVLRGSEARRMPRWWMPRSAAAFGPLPRALPASGREITGVRRLFPLGTTWLGNQATEPEIRRALGTGALVHVATHGIMNPHNPMFSRIELARGEGRSAADDGRLEVHEVLGLTVRSPLVFLSGCETGLGSGWSSDFAQREDYATLAQSFLFAGARTVIATLWRVDDAGAAEFAGQFYRHLRSKSPAQALAAAQRDLRRDPRYRSPYYWAGYVLSGEGGMR